MIDTFDVRSVSSSDLLTFFIKPSGGNSENSGLLLIDDLYIETTNDVNLLNPVPEPAGKERAACSARKTP